MLESFLSKMGLTVAVLIIIGVVLALFSVQLDSFREQELEVTCDTIQLRVDEVSSINAETEILFTYGEGRGGGAVKLPHLLNGKPYTMELYPEGVRIIQGRYGARADFQHTVHLFYPGSIEDITTSDLQTLDKEFDRLDIQSSEEFTIERRHFATSGFQTFLYKEGSDTDQTAVIELAEEIDSFALSVEGGRIPCEEGDVVVVPNFVILFSEGYAGVAQVHVNHTFDPEELDLDLDDTEGIPLEDFLEQCNVRNGRVQFSRGEDIHLERVAISIQVEIPVTGKEEPELRTLDVFHSFIYAG